MSLNKNYSVYCVKPRSWKPHVTCKWGGPKWQGILQLLPAINIEESNKILVLNNLTCYFPWTQYLRTFVRQLKNEDRWYTSRKLGGKRLLKTLVIKFREIAGVCNFALMVGSRSKQHKQNSTLHLPDIKKMIATRRLTKETIFRMICIFILLNVRKKDREDDWKMYKF